MNMIYKNNKLYVELLGRVSSEEIDIMKRRLWGILKVHNIDDIIINVDDIFSLKKDIFNDFLEEYHRDFRGNITISNK